MEFSKEFWVGVLVGIVAVLALIECLVRFYIYSIQRNLQSSSNVKVDNEIITASLEKINDTFYISRTDNHEFIAQGQTLDQLRQGIENKYRSKNLEVRVTDDSGNVLPELWKR